MGKMEGYEKCGHRRCCLGLLWAVICRFTPKDGAGSKHRLGYSRAAERAFDCGQNTAAMDHWRDMPWTSKMAMKSIDIGGVTKREDEKVRTTQKPNPAGSRPSRCNCPPRYGCSRLCRWFCSWSFSLFIRTLSQFHTDDRGPEANHSEQSHVTPWHHTTQQSTATIRWPRK